MENLKIKYFLINCIVFIMVCPVYVYPGIVIEQVERSTNFEGMINTVLFFSGNNMRMDDLENKTSTVSLFGEDTGYFISHKKKFYFRYKLSEKAKEEMKNTGQNQEKPAEDSSSVIKNKKIEVIKTSEKKVVNGFNVAKINIMVDNELVEEDWVTNDMDMTEVKNIIEKMKKLYSTQAGNEEDEIAKALEKHGFSILSKRYSTFLNNEKVEDVIEVIKVEKKALSNNLFGPPFFKF
ncbi:DUF4412 domain-containing protein [Candidatus Desantisbacteria bacterium]|nr:DUF4412 domain-containing protein [Candidatus Desantisbacteria bacterium]